MTDEHQKRVEEIGIRFAKSLSDRYIPDAAFLLDLLREQQAELEALRKDREPVAPAAKGGEYGEYPRCRCFHVVHTWMKFCHNCGSQLKWLTDVASAASEDAQTPLDGDELAAAAFVANRDTPYESTVRELLRRALATIEVLRKDRTRLTVVVEQLRMILTGAYFRMQDQIDASRAASEPQTADAAATRATEPESKLCDHGKDRSKQFCEECRMDEDSEAEMPGGFNG